MSEPLLDIDGLGVRYGAVTAVRDFSCSMAQGEFLAIIGTNGAGKSSVLKAILGMVRASQGTVRFGADSRVISGLAPHQVVRRGIALVPEGRRMLADMTVEENLLVGALAARGRRARSLDDIFDVFPRLRERRTQRAGSLSGGEQQMVAIGRALISAPQLLLLDEPSLGLAPSVARDLYVMIQEINRGGVAVLLVDQNVPLAMDVATRYQVMRSGEVVGSGATADAERELERLPALMGLEDGAGDA